MFDGIPFDVFVEGCPVGVGQRMRHRDIVSRTGVVVELARISWSTWHRPVRLATFLVLISITKQEH
jgi:hypothetical protein